MNETARRRMKDQSLIEALAGHTPPGGYVAHYREARGSELIVLCGYTAEQVGRANDVAKARGLKLQAGPSGLLLVEATP